MNNRTRLPEYSSARQKYEGLFNQTSSEKNFENAYEACLSALNHGPDSEIPYAFAYAARFVLCNPRNWDMKKLIPLPIVEERISDLLSLTRAINFRDNYYYPIVSGLKEYVFANYELSYQKLADASRFPDFYRVVKDDFGGGASFAKTFPSKQQLSLASSRLDSQISFQVKGTKKVDLVYSVAFDRIYGQVFSSQWIQKIQQLNDERIGVHFHSVFCNTKELSFQDELAQMVDALKGRAWISSEMMPIPRDKAYFASARFLQGANIIEEIGCPIWFVDADAEIAHEAKEAMRLTRDTSTVLGVISRGPFAYLPWRSFAAGWLYVPYHPSAIAYLRLVSDCIRYLWDDRPGRNWWIDQFALRTAEIIAKDGADIPPPTPVSTVTTNTFITGRKNTFLAAHPDIKALMDGGLSFKEAYARVALGT